MLNIVNIVLCKANKIFKKIQFNSYFTCCHDNTNILFIIEYFINYLPLHTKNKKEVNNEVTDLVNDQGHVVTKYLLSEAIFHRGVF